MLATVLAGAVLLASGAYAAGTQVGGGSASAKDEQDRVERGFAIRGEGPPGFAIHHEGPPDFGNLADKLGVSEAKLEDALKSLRDELGPKNPPKVKFRGKGPHPVGPPGMAFGIAGPGDDLAEELAGELGIEKSKIDAALENIEKKHVAEAKAKRDEFAQKLADKLGISVDKVKEAFKDGPFGGPLAPPRHP